MTSKPNPMPVFAGSPVAPTSYLLIRIGGMRFGVKALKVHRILSSTGIATGCWGGCMLPAVGHVDGRVVPVVQLDSRLEMEPATPREGAAVLVLRSARAMNGELLVGLMVDAVGQIIQVSPWAGQPVTETKPPCPYVTRQVDHEGETTNLLDLDSLFTLEAMAECCMSQAQANGESSIDLTDTVNNQTKSNQTAKP